jgi:hypothetical protein
MSNANQGENKVVPLYRRYDSKAECYRRATVTGMKTPHKPFLPPTLEAPKEGEAK